MKKVAKSIPAYTYGAPEVAASRMVMPGEIRHDNTH